MKSQDQNELQQFHNKSNKDSGKRMPVWLLVITDILITCCCIGGFMLYHYVLPRHLDAEDIIVATTDDGEATTFTLPAMDAASVAGNNESTQQKAASEDGESAGTEDHTALAEDESVAGQDREDESEASDSTDTGHSYKPRTDSEAAANDRKTPNKGRDSHGHIINYGNSDTMDIEADQLESEIFSSTEKIVTQVNSYSSDNIRFITNRIEVGSGNDKITYFISDVYVTNVKYLKTAFAKGQYGKNIRESTLQQAIDNNALLAINGDYYGNNEIGIVIRNGVLYRSEIYDADICVLFTDGTMETYSPDEFILDDIVDQGAWQAWIFGPQLLDGDGNVLTTFNSTYYLSLAHPRTAIGYVEPGHYVFLVVDGRNKGYSRGATLTEMAQMMADAGCKYAYNLDGGESSEMVYQGEFVNKPSQDGRDVSDIIYLGEE